jgi:sugar phosphate isomerase/epimerase
MDRRKFLIDAAVVATGSLFPRPAFASSTSGRKLGILGIQVSAVHAGLNKDFSGTLARVAALGYREIELVWWFGNFDRTPKQLRAALDAAGLSAPSGHISAGALWVGWERRLEQAHILGHEYLFCTDFGADTQISLDDWREWADRFNRAGETARKAGIWLGLHNEDTGFQPIEGQVPYDVFLNHTDASLTRHQLDIGNLALAGRDPVEYVRRYGNRYWSFHLKDRPESPSGSNVPGEGAINFKALLSLIPNLDRKHFIVEFDAEDNAALEAAAKSYQYLRSLSF